MLYAETAPLLPHCCFLCHNGSGPFVDLQSDDNDVRDEGLAHQFGAVFHLYLCVTCAMSAAQVVEKASVSTIVARHVLDDERRIHRELAERAALLTEENEHLRAAVGVIRTFEAAQVPELALSSVGTDTVSTTTPAPRKPARR